MRLNRLPRLSAEDHILHETIIYVWPSANSFPRFSHFPPPLIKALLDFRRLQLNLKTDSRSVCLILSFKKNVSFVRLTPTGQRWSTADNWFQRFCSGEDWTPFYLSVAGCRPTGPTVLLTFPKTRLDKTPAGSKEQMRSDKGASGHEVQYEVILKDNELNGFEQKKHFFFLFFYIFEKNFIVFWSLVVTHISNIKRTIGMKIAWGIRHELWMLEEPKEQKSCKTTPLTGHHAAEEYDLNTCTWLYHWVMRYLCHTEATNMKTQSRKKCTVEYCVYSKLDRR